MFLVFISIQLSEMHGVGRVKVSLSLRLKCRIFDLKFRQILEQNVLLQLWISFTRLTKHVFNRTLSWTVDLFSIAIFEIEFTATCDLQCCYLFESNRKHLFNEVRSLDDILNFDEIKLVTTFVCDGDLNEKPLPIKLMDFLVLLWLFGTCMFFVT